MLFTPDVSEAEMFFKVRNSTANGNVTAELIHFTDIAVEIAADNSVTCWDEKLVQVFKKGFSFRRVGGSVNANEVNLTTGKIN